MSLPESPPISAKQMRAARALLAWSQQDLAKNAGVAASTVADFERGQRTPVPNNAEAMKSALEKEGVAFLPGGAVIGPYPPPLGDVTKSGMPIRWVNATDLSRWAETRDGQGSISTLLAKLVRAGRPTTMHFPSDEAIQQAGWDGITDAEVGSEYVPAGPTGWEIGTQRTGITAKANEDYEKRTKDPGHLNPSQSTFIFLTPRPWSDKDRWAQERRAEGKWRDVRAYDGTDLVHWIELNPAVGQWLATYLGKRPPGARQLEEVWAEWSFATEMPLTTELILADRDEDAAATLRWLRSSPTAFALQGAAADEVAAFLYAVIDQLPEEFSSHYLARCVVAANADAARALADGAPAIIILLDPPPGLGQVIAKKGHHVLMAYGASPVGPGVKKLERPSREGIKSALVGAGLLEDRADSLAHESFRSLAILRRLLPGQPGRVPAWAQTKPPHAVIAALLAGGWDEQSEADKAVLSRLSDTSYEDFVTAVTPYVGYFDSPLRKVGSTWKIASPQDAWLLLAQYLSPADLKRFELAVMDVLSSDDPRYSMPSDERWYAPIRGVHPEFSETLRHGFGEILIMVALFGDRAETVPNALDLARHVVRKLLEGADGQRWWSLSRDFRLLAEAAPEAFLSAVEHSLDLDDPPIRALFGSDESPVFGTEHLSDLLWALESLAWSPVYFSRVVHILTRLDQIDPGGRYSNRPAECLRALFVLWHPQTDVPLQERLRVLERIIKLYPEAAWKLMLNILPSGHDTLTPAATTRWRDLTSDRREVVTYALIHRGAQAITERLIQAAGTNLQRWAQLLDKWQDLGIDRARATTLLAEAISNSKDEEGRSKLWARLRSLLNHHRDFPDANWSIPEVELRELEKIYDSLQPHDPIAQINWVFENGASLPNPEGGWEQHEQQLRDRRLEIGKSLVDKGDIEFLFSLAETIEASDTLGRILIEAGLTGPARDAVIERALQNSARYSRSLAHGLINASHWKDGQQWTEALFARALTQKWGDEAVLALLLAVPATPSVWKMAHDAGAAIETKYWQKVDIFWINVTEAGPERPVDELLKVGRGRSAVHFLGAVARKTSISSELMVRALMQAVKEEGGSGPGNETTMFQYHVVEMMKRLDEADDVSPETMFHLEWAYLALLEHSKRPATVIMNAVSEKPELFIQLIRAVFKPSEESGIVEDAPEDAEGARRVARQAYSLLNQWSVVPGTDADGRIDGAKLEAWVKEARKQAALIGREIIADQKIGEMLAASPMGSDGNWPAEAVRDLIETVRSKHVETGFELGHINRRGVTMRAPRDGGAQERSLAERYRQYSRAIALEWPRTSAALEDIAKNYERDAQWHDEDAERLDW